MLAGVAARRVVRRAGGLGFDWSAAVAHLAGVDERLAGLIDRVGPVRLELDAFQSTFEALARSIVFQQLTARSAGTIHGRLKALFPAGRVKPEALLTHSDEALRAVGLSRGKIAALRDLSARTLDGTIPEAVELHAMADEVIVERLIVVRGIGRWTAEMLLIFGLGRPDVLPVDDYGVRYGFMLTYRKRAMPTPKEVTRRAERWRPFRTVASWYMWRAVDLFRRRDDPATP
jgi:3-methyladenine DNA glycosylase/8-oxoguanine DNA glycosylase